MSKEAMAVEYYKALLGDRNNRFDKETFRTLKNSTYQYIFKSPEGMTKFIENIDPKKCKIMFFDKPWEWYSTYKDYPDVLSYVLNRYYTYLYKNNLSIHIGSKDEFFGAEKGYGTSTCSTYDEYYSMLEFSKFCANTESVDIPFELACAMAYNLMLVKDWKVSYQLYVKFIRNKKPSISIKSDLHFIDFFMSVMEAEKSDDKYFFPRIHPAHFVKRPILEMDHLTYGNTKGILRLLNSIADDAGKMAVWNITPDAPNHCASLRVFLLELDNEIEFDVYGYINNPNIIEKTLFVYGCLNVEFYITLCMLCGSHKIFKTDILHYSTLEHKIKSYLRRNGVDVPRISDVEDFNGTLDKIASMYKLMSKSPKSQRN